VLNFLVDNFALGPYADEALRRVAQYKFLSGDYPGAIAAYERILRTYPGSTWRDLAEYRIGIAHLRSVQRADLDRSELLRAHEALASYLESRLEGTRLEEARAALAECEERLAESEYRIAEFYRTIDQPFGARLHYENAITGYPGTEYAAKAEERIDDLPASAPSGARP
jgi:outer membrane assembly lipoprotein YfiO